MGKTFLKICLLFVSVNLLLFCLYRLCFLGAFHNMAEVDHRWLVLVYGVRLDLALLSFELLGIGIVALVMRNIRLRLVWLLCLGMTYLHAVMSLANFYFFRERNLQLGEKLFAYITTPEDIYVYGGGFLVKNSVLALTAAAGSVLLVLIGWRYSRKLHEQVICLRHPVKWLTTALFFALLLLPTLEKVTVKKNNIPSGWRAQFTHAKHYATLDNFLLNQAVPNPFFDLFRVYLPAFMRPSYQDRLAPQESLRLCQELLKITPANAQNPLLSQVEGHPGYAALNIHNVVLIQVEGLSQSMLSKQVDGRWVMPFLQKLTNDGLYFPNLIQGFNATAGAVFCTAASFPKGSFEELARRFTSYEMNGHYGTLARILGASDYDHYFGEAFRESYIEYVSFMSNQGYQCFGYPQFCERLAQKKLLAQADDVQGIFDGYFLQEGGAIILGGKKKYYTAHFMTVTSHSPWSLPESFSSPFTDRACKVFHYVDASIEALVEQLQQSPKFAETLVVVVADHTSVTFGDNLMERLRIPLILYSKKMAELQLHGKRECYGSQLDVLPTILGCMPGNWPYSGMGRNLLAVAADHSLAISANSLEGFYLKGDFLLQYRPNIKEAQLFLKKQDEVVLRNVAQEYKDIVAQMEREYLAYYETARFLARSQQIFPIQK